MCSFSSKCVSQVKSHRRKIVHHTQNTKRRRSSRLSNSIPKNMAESDDGKSVSSEYKFDDDYNTEEEEQGEV